MLNKIKQIKFSSAGRFQKSIVLIIILLLFAVSWGRTIDTPVAGRAGGQLAKNRSSSAGQLTKNPSSSIRWGLKTIEAEQGWKITKGKENVVVAVIDSGINWNISSLENRMWVNKAEVPADGVDNDGNGYVDDKFGWNFRNDQPLDTSRSNLYYHGSFIAGLLSSLYNTDVGTGGVAPGVKIMDLRFLDNEGLFYTSDWYRLKKAIDYAVDNGADIINLSLYANAQPPSFVHQAIQRAVARNVLVVGISGNQGGKISQFGTWKEILTVGAIDNTGERANFSNYGPELDIMAPGKNVLSFLPDGRVVTGSGTSFAAPHVAGTAALILSKNPSMTVEELTDLLTKTAFDMGKPGPDDLSGSGVVNVSKALSETE